MYLVQLFNMIPTVGQQGYNIYWLINNLNINIIPTIITHLIESYCKIFLKGVARGKYFTIWPNQMCYNCFITSLTLLRNFKDIMEKILVYISREILNLVRVTPPLDAIFEYLRKYRTPRDRFWTNQERLFSLENVIIWINIHWALMLSPSLSISLLSRCRSNKRPMRPAGSEQVANVPLPGSPRPPENWIWRTLRLNTHKNNSVR